MGLTTAKLINKGTDSTSVIVERYIFILQIYQSNIYNHVNKLYGHLFAQIVVKDSI